MKIEIVLTACNLVNKYITNYPIVYKVWKERFDLDCYLILISDKIPDILIEYKDYIILFPEFDNINSAYISQVIRILYPALLENKNVLITDIDIIPISHYYFIEGIQKYDNDSFITFTDRYVYRKNPMYAMCYNIANSETWKEIFNIHSIDDIKLKLKEWYNINYTGIKNCEGWYTDQLKLYENVQNWINKKSKLIILKDKDIRFKRLNNRARDISYIKQNFELVKENIKNSVYSDIHLSKRLPNKMLNELIDLLI